MSSSSHPAGAKLTLARNRANDVRRRQVYVSLDDEKLGYLLYGGSITRDIAPGHHTLKANNTLFWKRVEFEVAAGEHVQFALTSYTGKGFWPILLFFGIAPIYLSIEREDAGR